LKVARNREKKKRKKTSFNSKEKGKGGEGTCGNDAEGAVKTRWPSGIQRGDRGGEKILYMERSEVSRRKGGII